MKAVCPTKNIGYYFFDYARFYNKRGKVSKALGKANASLSRFREVSGPNVGRTLAAAMIAST